jgi:predicted nucleic acid-binding protein
MNPLDFLDANVWLALFWNSHIHSEKARNQFHNANDQEFFFCRFTQLTVLRLLTTEKAMRSEHARRLVQGYVEHYNNIRPNSAVGYITPKDMLAARQQEIDAERDRKLEQARKERQVRRQNAA